MAILKYINDQGDEDQIHVGEDRPEVSIGRHKDCGLKTGNNTVSRRHARILWRDGTYLLEDLDSANGTFFRRERIKSIELEDGETIYCGTFQIGFKLDHLDRERIADTEEEPPPVPLAVEETLEPGKTLGYEVPSPLNPPVSLDPPEKPVDDVVSFSEDSDLEKTAHQGTEEEPAPVSRREETTDLVSEVVKFDQSSSPEAARLLKEEKERESREADLASRVSELEEELAQRDGTVKQLALQAEELGNLVARYEAEQNDEAADLKIADLERVIASAEAEKSSLEEELSGLRAEHEDREAHARDMEGQVAELTGKVEELSKRQVDESEIDRQKTELEGAQARATGLEDELKAAWEKVSLLEKERGALVEENQRWESLKKQFEAESSSAREEIVDLEKQVADLKAPAVDAEAAARKVEELSTKLGETNGELSEVKLANRSYLKKISRLLEENEKIKAQIDAATESEAAGGDAGDVRKLIEEINEMISGTRTSLEILLGMLPDVAEHMDGTDNGSDALEQVRNSSNELAGVVRDVKKKVVEARGLFKE